MSKILCFKPMRQMHESGFRYIQYGYMAVDDDFNESVKIIGQYDILQTPYEPATPFNLDLTKSGWFRIMPRKNQELEWKYGGTISVVTPNQPNIPSGEKE